MTRLSTGTDPSSSSSCSFLLLPLQSSPSFHSPSLPSPSSLISPPPGGAKARGIHRRKRRGPCTYWTQLTTSASIFALARVQRFTFLKAVCAYDERLDGWSSGSRTGLERGGTEIVYERKGERERERERERRVAGLFWTNYCQRAHLLCRPGYFVPHKRRFIMADRVNISRTVYFFKKGKKKTIRHRVPYPWYIKVLF